MSQLSKIQKPVKPSAMILFHQDLIDGLPVKVFAAHWRIVIRVVIHPNGRAIEITCKSEKLCENTLTQLMQMAVEEAKKLLPQAKSLSPKKLTL